MAELIDLVTKERAAQARMNAVMSASNGRCMTAEERQEFETAEAERDSFDVQIDNLLAAEGPRRVEDRPSIDPGDHGSAGAVLAAYQGARTAAVAGKSPAADMAAANMRRQLAANGIKPAT